MGGRIVMGSGGQEELKGDLEMAEKLNECICLHGKRLWADIAAQMPPPD